MTKAHCVLALCATLIACTHATTNTTPDAATREAPPAPRKRTGPPWPGMRSLCQDAALLWPCPERGDMPSGDEAVRESLRR